MHANINGAQSNDIFQDEKTLMHVHTQYNLGSKTLSLPFRRRESRGSEKKVGWNGSMEVWLD